MTNIQNSFDKVYGIPEGILYGQNERVDELNSRIHSRMTSDYILAPNFTPRATPTRQTLLPMITHRFPAKVPIKPALDHHVHINFNSSNTRGPPSGYINNVDVETALRNQNTVLQHGAPQGIYIPSSKSDLYNVRIPLCSNPEPQPFPNMAKVDRIYTYVPESLQANQIGLDKFNNHTRTQLRNM